MQINEACQTLRLLMVLSLVIVICRALAPGVRSSTERAATCLFGAREKS
jgi:hypothetical protein